MNKRQEIPVGFSTWLEFYKSIVQHIEFISNGQVIKHGFDSRTEEFLLEITLGDLKIKCFDEMILNN